MLTRLAAETRRPGTQPWRRCPPTPRVFRPGPCFAALTCWPPVPPLFLSAAGPPQRGCARRLPGLHHQPGGRQSKAACHAAAAGVSSPSYHGPYKRAYLAAAAAVSHIVPSHISPTCVNKQIMVLSTMLPLVAGRFGLAPTSTRHTNAGVKLLPQDKSAGLMSNDPAGGCPAVCVWWGWGWGWGLGGGTLRRSRAVVAWCGRRSPPRSDARRALLLLSAGFNAVDVLALGAFGHIFGVGLVLVSFRRSSPAVGMQAVCISSSIVCHGLRGDKSSCPPPPSPPPCLCISR